MVKLKISDIEEMRLIFSEFQRFAICKLSYKDKVYEMDMSEDYLYILIENMLGRIQSIPIVKQTELFGKMGKWQEYFYYDVSDIERHSIEIELMKKSIFVSTEKYGTFLYNYNGNVWLEVNRGYDEECGMSPIEFYDDSANYQLLLRKIPDNILYEWKKILSEVTGFIQE